MERTRLPKALASVALAVSLGGCAWVELKPQGEPVRILTAAQVGKCKALGQVTASTAATIGFIARDKSSVQEEVNRLARNHAGGMGGDTVVAKGALADGEQTFGVYRCIAQ